MDVRQYFFEFNRHLLEDKKPSVYFEALLSGGSFPGEYPFSMLKSLPEIHQSPVHHPEGNVWNHTMQVLDNAAERKELSREPSAFMWAALLHDIGKVPATKIRKGRITAYDHDAEGEKLAEEFLKRCTEDNVFITKVCALVRWHMQMLYVINRLPYADLKKMKTQADAREVALLAFCDRLGRGQMSKDDIEKELQNVDYFLNRCGLKK